ncbi:hypothetical protein GUITHDRAFT_101492 [Guillardia theta CCMP2712]|uniref:Uncharacterized protein n=2 Tax=Guillardia theta TaxID=55529 RepID=L1JXF4_GUITC|nr:hypothetical protein GUITHDRAFT_101492 [Guillardia theta CCMP2712]EKX53047.1 hypothetical protein GUITHDRAFT_101492 [Guillardia theta CCMP2712]|eukprot:XP_005840027.1 hypothetical protein GUITHDRAFT_101492 [Guillardia theta CCMP2712]
MARTTVHRRHETRMSYDHMKILHGELLEGILSFVNEEVDTVIDEKIQQDSLKLSNSKQDVGRIHCQSIKTFGISETSIIKIVFIQVHLNGIPLDIVVVMNLDRKMGLQQTHSRLLAIVDSDHSLMPHLLVEIVHTEESISVVYADFVPRTPNEMLMKSILKPDEYTRSVSPILQNNLSLVKSRYVETARKSKESRPNNNFSLDGVQQISAVGQIPSSSSPFQVLIPAAQLTAVIALSVRNLIGEWLALLRVTAPFLAVTDRMLEGIWQQEKLLDLSLFNPRDDPLASRLNRIDHTFIVNIRNFLNLGPLTQRHTGIQVKHTVLKTSRMSKLHGAKECAKSSIMAFDDPDLRKKMSCAAFEKKAQRFHERIDVRSPTKKVSHHLDLPSSPTSLSRNGQRSPKTNSSSRMEKQRRGESPKLFPEDQNSCHWSAEAMMNGDEKRVEEQVVKLENEKQNLDASNNNDEESMEKQNGGEGEEQDRGKGEEEDHEDEVERSLLSKMGEGLGTASPAGHPTQLSPARSREDGAASRKEEDEQVSEPEEGASTHQQDSFNEISEEEIMAAAARAMNILDLHILRSHRQQRESERKSPSDCIYEEEKRGRDGGMLKGDMEGISAKEEEKRQHDEQEGPGDQKGQDQEQEQENEQEQEEEQEEIAADEQEEHQVHEEGYEGGNSSNEDEHSSGGDEFEHVSKREALWTDCNLDELKKLDERSWEIVSSLRQIPVATLQVEAEQRLSGPLRSSSSRGQKSVMLHVLNCTTLSLSLQRYGGEQMRWAILPPPEISPGEEIVMASESLGGLLSSPSAEVAYEVKTGEGGGGESSGGFGSVEFYMRWELSLSGRVVFSSSASPGWHVEREYLNGNSGSHATSRFFLLRTPCPLSFIALQESYRMGHRQRKEGSSSLRQHPLNLFQLDCDLHAGLRCTRERTRHIVSWLHRCSFPLSGLEKEGNLDILVLLGVHAEAARLELLKSFSTPLGLAHVVAEVGCRSLGLTGDSGILLASKFPVLSHRFFSFPGHDGCSHPGINLPKGSYGGMLAVLLDLSRRRAGDRLVVFVSTVPNQEAIWKAMRKAMSSFMSACQVPTSTSAALLIGKFEGVPFLSKGLDVREGAEREGELAAQNHLLLPVMELRDLLMDPKPSEERGGGSAKTFGGLGEAVARSLAIGTYSSAKFPRTWDPTYNSLAASVADKKRPPRGSMAMPCRISAILAVDAILGIDDKNGSSRGGGDQGYPQAQKCVREDMMSQVMRECFRPVECLHISVEPLGATAASQPSGNYAVLASLIISDR